MGLFKQKGKYGIDYYFEGQRVREVVGNSKREAAEALAVKKAEIVQGRYHFKSKSENLRLKDLSEQYLEYSKANKKSYVRDTILVKHLVTFFKNKKCCCWWNYFFN